MPDVAAMLIRKDQIVRLGELRLILGTLHSILEHAIGQDWIATNAAHRANDN